VISYTFFVLRYIELGYQFGWDDAVAILPCLKMAYEAGYDPAAKYAYRFCTETRTLVDTPQTSWIVNWRDEFMVKATRLVPEKNRVGRRKGPTPRKWMEDLEIFVLVNFWCGQVGDIYQTGQPHWISRDRAFEIVRVMRYRDQVFAEGDRRFIETLENTYERTVKRCWFCNSVYQNHEA
jgi:hypothetical protein